MVLWVSLVVKGTDLSACLWHTSRRLLQTLSNAVQEAVPIHTHLKEFFSAERKLGVGEINTSPPWIYFGPSQAHVSKHQCVQYLLPKDFCTSLPPGIIRDGELGGFIRIQIWRYQHKLCAAEFYLRRIQDSKISIAVKAGEQLNIA